MQKKNQQIIKIKRKSKSDKQSDSISIQVFAIFFNFFVIKTRDLFNETTNYICSCVWWLNPLILIGAHSLESSIK